MRHSLLRLGYNALAAVSLVSFAGVFVLALAFISPETGQIVI